MPTEYDCEGCGWHVVAVALNEPPPHMFCVQCAFLCEHVPDPEEMIEIHRKLNHDKG